MPKLAANLSMLFREHSFPDRFAAAADAGFEAVEYQFPYDDGSPEDIAQAVHFLACAPYVTGQVVAVDGGRSIFL